MATTPDPLKTERLALNTEKLALEKERKAIAEGEKTRLVNKITSLEEQLKGVPGLKDEIESLKKKEEARLASAAFEEKEKALKEREEAFEKKIEEGKKPTSIEIDPAGGKGNYLISVISKDKNGETINPRYLIFEDGIEVNPHRLSEKNGILSFKILFETSFLELKVSILGSDNNVAIEKKITLYWSYTNTKAEKEK